MANSALRAHAAKLQKDWGDRAVTAAPGQRERIPTGSLVLDHVLRGGWPVGLICEVLGPPDTGKSTVAISSLKNAQEMFPERGVCYVDMEKTFDYEWAAGLGLKCAEEDIESGIWAHLYPNDSEDASDMARKQAMTGLYSMIILDSIGGMESRKAFEKDSDKPVVGTNAQIITRMVKHLASLARMKKCSIILINQPRAAGVGTGMPLPDKSAGPGAMQHQTAVKVTMSKGSEAPRYVKLDGEDGDSSVVSVQVKTRLTRSKICPPGRVGEFWINNQYTDLYGPPGIFVADEFATMGVKHGVIMQKNTWYEFPDGQKVQGRQAIGPFLQANHDLMASLRTAILEAAA